MARHIARVLGLGPAGPGYYGVLKPNVPSFCSCIFASIISRLQSHVVTWSNGHLIDWTDVDGEATKWNLSHLPLLPQAFRLIPAKVPAIESSSTPAPLFPLLTAPREAISS